MKTCPPRATISCGQRRPSWADLVWARGAREPCPPRPWSDPSNRRRRERSERSRRRFADAFP